MRAHGHAAMPLLEEVQLKLQEETMPLLERRSAASTSEELEALLVAAGLAAGPARSSPRSRIRRR